MQHLLFDLLVRAAFLCGDQQPKSPSASETRFKLYCQIMNTVSPYHQRYIKWLISNAMSQTGYITIESCELFIREILLLYNDDSLVSEYDYVREWTHDNL